MEDPRRTRWFPVVVKSVLRTSGFVCEGRRWPIYVYRFYVHLTFTPLPLAGRILLIHLKNICHGVFASLICRNTDGTPRAFAASTHLQSRRVNSSGFGFQLRMTVIGEEMLLRSGCSSGTSARRQKPYYCARALISVSRYKGTYCSEHRAAHCRVSPLRQPHPSCASSRWPSDPTTTACHAPATNHGW
jgi:hypothetical protein